MSDAINLKYDVCPNPCELVKRLLDNMEPPIECSLCDNGKNPEKLWGGARWAYNYCPNCGRKLEVNY